MIFHENIFPFAFTKLGECTKSFLPKDYIVPKDHVPTLVPHSLATEDNSIPISPITKSGFPNDRHFGFFESTFSSIIPTNIPSTSVSPMVIDNILIKSSRSYKTPSYLKDYICNVLHLTNVTIS